MDKKMNNITINWFDGETRGFETEEFVLIVKAKDGQFLQAFATDDFLQRSTFTIAREYVERQSKKDS